MEKLPYDFDLIWDIKTVKELHGRILRDCLDDAADVYELMDHYNVPYPEDFIKPNLLWKMVIWADSDGSYITNKPTEEEEHKYRRYVIKPMRKS